MPKCTQNANRIFFPGSGWPTTCRNATFIVWKAHVAAQITNPHGIK